MSNSHNILLYDPSVPMTLRNKVISDLWNEEFIDGIPHDKGLKEHFFNDEETTVKAMEMFYSENRATMIITALKYRGEW